LGVRKDETDETTRLCESAAEEGKGCGTSFRR